MEEEDFKDEGEEEEKADVEEEEEEEQVEDEGEDEEIKEKRPSRTTKSEKTSKWMLYSNITALGAMIIFIGLERWKRGTERDLVVYQAVQQILISLPLMFAWIPVIGWAYAVVYIVITIMAIVKSNKGECWEMPLVGDQVYKALGQEP